MNIGLTYDLRSDYLLQGYSMEETAEFDKESTIEGIETAIWQAGHTTDRIGNGQALMHRLMTGDRWDLVFNIAEGMYGAGRESLVPALLDHYRIPYTFSGPATLACSLNKAYAKRIVRDAGVETPPFNIVYTMADIRKIHMNYPLFAKPVSEGTGKGIDRKSVIRTPEGLHEVCERLLKDFKQPVLVEEFLPGREFTVGVIGSGRDAWVPGAMEIRYIKNGEQIYSYENKENFEEIVDYLAVKGEILNYCSDVALRVWRTLNCLDGGRVDVRFDREGNLNFIEVNPLAGLNPVISDLPILCRLNGMDYHQLIAEILGSALKRNGLS